MRTESVPSKVVTELRKGSASFSKLVRRIGSTAETLRAHLEKLLIKGVIYSKNEKSMRYFLKTPLPSVINELDTNITDLSGIGDGVISELRKESIHLSELARRLDRSAGSLYPYLEKLMDKGIIDRQEESYERFFLTKTFFLNDLAEESKGINGPPYSELEFENNTYGNVSDEIINELRKGGVYLSELARRLGRSRGCLYRHLERLMEKGIIYIRLSI